MYVTYIVVGCIVLEFVYGKVGDAIFDSINKGVRTRLLHLMTDNRRNILFLVLKNTPNYVPMPEGFPGLFFVVANVISIDPCTFILFCGCLPKWRCVLKLPWELFIGRCFDFLDHCLRQLK